MGKGNNWVTFKISTFIQDYVLIQISGLIYVLFPSSPKKKKTENFSDY